MNMRTRSRAKIFAGKLSFIALIDLLFLLFVFFLVSNSLIFQPGVPVDLPSAEGVSRSEAEKIIVTISENGDIFINDRPVPDYELQNMLRERVEERTAFTTSRLNLTEEEAGRRHAPRIVLRADRRVNYEQIVEVMSLSRSLGLGVYLITDPESSVP